MKKDLVKYNNEFNLTDLNSLSKAEQDIFFSICSEFTKLKKEKIEISFFDLKKKAQMTDSLYTDTRFLSVVTSAMKKIGNIYFHVSTSSKEVYLHLFDGFELQKDENKFVILLGKEFRNYFYDIPDRLSFTQFELEAFLGLKSKYEKTLLRFLLQNFTGTWKLPFSDFRKIMGFPKSYPNGVISARLDKIVKELNQTEIVSDLSYSLTHKAERGNPVKDISFSYFINKEKYLESQGQMPLFSPVIETKTISETEIVQPVDGLPTLQQVQKTVAENKKCPKCGADVILKTDKQGRKYHCCKNSNYWFSGACRWMEYINDKNCDIIHKGKTI